MTKGHCITTALKAKEEEQKQQTGTSSRLRHHHDHDTSDSEKCRPYSAPPKNFAVLQPSFIVDNIVAQHGGGDQVRRQTDLLAKDSEEWESYQAKIAEKPF